MAHKICKWNFNNPFPFALYDILNILRSSIEFLWVSEEYKHQYEIIYGRQPNFIEKQKGWRS